MTDAARRVLYAEDHTVVAMVERASAESIDRPTAENVLGLVALSYQVQFEEKMYGRFRVPPGTIDEAFRPGSSSRVSGHQDRMLDHIDLGGQYWFLRADSNFAVQDAEDTDSINEGDIVALAKVTPVKPEDAGMYDDVPMDCYVNDVITDPRLQRRGIGSTALHAALIGSGSNPNGIVSLDGYIGNMGPNRLFARVMGLRRRYDKKVRPYPLTHEVSMPQVRYETPADMTLRGVVRRLEEKKPLLRSGIVLPA